MQNPTTGTVPTLTVDFCPGFVCVSGGGFVFNIALHRLHNVISYWCGCGGE